MENFRRTSVLVTTKIFPAPRGILFKTSLQGSRRGMAASHGIHDHVRVNNWILSVLIAWIFFLDIFLFPFLIILRNRNLGALIGFDRRLGDFLLLFLLDVILHDRFPYQGASFFFCFEAISSRSLYWVSVNKTWTSSGILDFKLHDDNLY